MNLPNKLTMLRIVLTFVYMIAALAIPQMPALAPFPFSLKDLVLLAIFTIAALSDFLDGYLARKNHLITSFGKFADPLADKAIIDTALILFVYFHQCDVAAVLLMLLRDLMVDGLRFVAASHQEVVSAGFSGKVKTVLQMAAIIFILLQGWPVSLLIDAIWVQEGLLWLATAASLYSGWVYFSRLKHYVLESM